MNEKKDVEKSILEILGKSKTSFISFLVIFGLIQSLLTFIVGIIFLALFDGTRFLSIPFFFIGASFTGVVLYFRATLPLKSYYKHIKELADSGNEKQLLIISEIPNHKSILALYALFDLSSDSAKNLLKIFINNKSTSKNAQELAGLLIKKGIKLEESYSDSLETHDNSSVIPISKVFFINSETDLDICMISKTQLKLSDSVVICPSCANMAKKKLLEQWLLENGSCPVCRKVLSIQEFPLVERKG